MPDHRAQVSIGMPVYNGEATLRPALESLLAQDFTSFELNICDNGSTDATEEICREYLRRDNRIHYYRSNRNLGAAANFNRAFELGQSEYFMFAADDDTRQPDYLTKCIGALERAPEAVLCSTLFELIGTDGSP